jgi:hypothetical protein
MTQEDRRRRSIEILHSLRDDLGQDQQRRPGYDEQAPPEQVERFTDALRLLENELGSELVGSYHLARRAFGTRARSTQGRARAAVGRDELLTYVRQLLRRLGVEE